MTTTPCVSTRTATPTWADGERQYRDEFVSVHYETSIPVVRVHPETGRRVFCSGFSSGSSSAYGTAGSAARFNCCRHA